MLDGSEYLHGSWVRSQRPVWREPESIGSWICSSDGRHVTLIKGNHDLIVLSESSIPLVHHQQDALGYVLLPPPTIPVQLDGTALRSHRTKGWCELTIIIQSSVVGTAQKIGSPTTRIEHCSTISISASRWRLGNEEGGTGGCSGA